jgi:hypothetical protein
MEDTTGASLATAFPFYTFSSYVYTRLSIQGSVAVCGFLINSLAVVILLTKERPLSTQNRLLLNLFLVNCVLCTFVLPVHLYDLSLGISNDWGILCILQGLLLTYVQCSAIIAYLHITLHRYFAVVFIQSRLKRYATYGSAIKTGIIVGLCNLIPGLLMLPAVLGVWGKFGLEASHGTCNLLEDQNGGSASFNFFGSAFAIGVPLVTMFYCYAHIIYTVKTQHKKVAVAPMSMSMSGGGPSKQAAPKPSRQDLRLTMAMVLIISLFLFSFVPYQRPRKCRLGALCGGACFHGSCHLFCL